MAFPAKKNRSADKHASSKIKTPSPKKSSDASLDFSAALSAKKARKPSVKKEENVEDITFPIVGIGASAGGLEAFEKFFKNLPAKTGMAFVLVQHLDPDHKSLLCEMIRRYTSMKVFEAEDAMKVEPDCTYIIPPKWALAIMHGALHLIEPAKPRGHRQPIDFFFRSLAQDQREWAVGIVLSGTGTEGAQGLCAIKEAGGMTIVQEPETAKYDGMPRSAIAAGAVDYLLAPEKMGEQLISYVRKFFLHGKAKVGKENIKEAILQKIFFLVRSQTGHDFSFYKPSTLIRRIERRMTIQQIGVLADYVRFLQENAAEVEKLFREFLIEVTNFFRDPEAFELIKEKAIRPLLETRSSQTPLRIWVPGCSTGEEAYSIAILIQEEMRRLNKTVKTQIFATDIDKDAVEKARSGIYFSSIAADVSPERLNHYFDQGEQTCQIKKSIRDMLVFSMQSVIKDPPFSKIDLISCRNLLIYLQPALQKKIVPLFHYALNPGGYLFLGSSETIGEFNDLFEAVHRKWKLYRRKGDAFSRRAAAEMPKLFLPLEADGAKAENKLLIDKPINHRVLAEEALLRYFSPACLIVDEKGEILYIHGRTGKYLEPEAGEAAFNVLRMAREGLRIKLTNAFYKSVAEKKEIRCEGISVKFNGGFQAVNLTVKPLLESPSLQGLLMVAFEDAASPQPAEGAPLLEASGEENRQAAELEKELRATREYLQSAIEELETANEELRSTNEELQSANEELQSTNEEHETSREELQSVNEELMTVNSELEIKINDLAKTRNDLANLLAGTNIATIFLDRELRIQRFTPAAVEIINLIDSDIGRPIGHIVSNLNDDALVQNMKKVLDSLIPQEKEVQTKNGLWHLMRILPYRTSENVIEGLVITFIDIAEQKKVQEQWREAQLFSEAVIETIREPLLILDGELKVILANRSFYDTFQVHPQDVKDRMIYNLGDRLWDIPDLRRLLEEIIPKNAHFQDYKVEHDFPCLGKRIMLLNARRLERLEQPHLILLAFEEVKEKPAKKRKE